MTFTEIEKKMKELGLTGRHLEKAMSGYHRSLKELSELSVGQVFSDWKVNLASLAKISLPILSIGALIKTFKALEDASVGLNREMLVAGVAAGKVSSSGYGSFGNIGSSEARVESVSTKNRMMNLGFSTEQISQVLEQAARSLPKDIADTVFPELAMAAADFSSKFGTDLGKTMDLMTKIFRRTGVSGDELASSFLHAVTIGSKHNMTAERSVDIFTNLYQNTANFGGTLKSTEKLMGTWSEAIKHGTVTQEEATAMFSSRQEKPLAAIAAFAKMSEGISGGKAGQIAKEVFGTGSMQDKIDHYLAATEKGLPELTPLLKAIAQKESGHLTGLGPLGRLDAIRGLIFPALDEAQGRQEFERKSGGFLFPGQTPTKDVSGKDVVNFSMRFQTFGQEMENAKSHTRGFYETEKLAAAKLLNLVNIFSDFGKKTSSTTVNTNVTVGADHQLVGALHESHKQTVQKVADIHGRHR